MREGALASRRERVLEYKKGYRREVGAALQGAGRRSGAAGGEKATLLVKKCIV